MPTPLPNHAPFKMPWRIIVFGVSGCGKTTLGKALAQAYALPFFDADDYHSNANRRKMSQAIPLNDQDRQPWLESLNRLLQSHGPCVLACSALKSIYRKTLSENISHLVWIYLQADKKTLQTRMKQRQHFMPPALLRSQLETFEPPSTQEINQQMITLQAVSPVDETVRHALQKLRCLS